MLSLLFGAPAVRPFDVRWWTGAVDRGRERVAPYTLLVASPGALRRMLLPPSELSIVEAYLGGDLDVEGDMEAASQLGDSIAEQVRSPARLARMVKHLLALPAHDGPAHDVSAHDQPGHGVGSVVRGVGTDVGTDSVATDTALAEAAADDPEAAVRAARAGRLVHRAGREHEPRRDAVAVRYHYDVGNDFYALWLDRRMVYSCAYFRAPAGTLEEAQRAKLDLICRKLRLRPGERLLDVGCGWGALVMHAAAEYGVEAVGITLSEEQARLARERIEAAGLADRCRIEVRDYREPVHGPPFHKISSVGMVEHVGEAKLPTYFAALRRALAPGGLLLNHGIVSVEEARPARLRDRLEGRLWKRGAFIDQYVFPDGRLAPLHAVIAAAEGAGFETRDVESLREHYVRTLRLWVARLMAHWPEAVAATDERTARTWRLYMAASAYGFASGRLNVVQTLLANPQSGRSGLPLTREDIYAVAPRAPAR